MNRVSINYNLFPGGLNRAVTLSYDDGVVEDRRLVEILNQHGLKASFHLNSGTLGGEKKLAPTEIAQLFRGHEVSAHSVTHPHLESVPREELVWQMLDDRQALEELVGYPVRGMSYPFGTYNPEVVAALPALGIEYARTVQSHGAFHVPENPLLWHPTCHHNHGLAEKTDAFLSQNARKLRLLYVWGHSYEFPHDNNWDVIERFAERVAREKVWCATNIEIIDYLQALKALRVSVNGHLIRNPSARPVWVTWNGQSREIPAGADVAL